MITLKNSGAHRFGIYDDVEFVGEFNFAFNHSALLKKEPKSAWIGIGIGNPFYRGKGIGTLAMVTIEREIKSLDGKRIELGVFSFNEPAIKFYEKLGYRRFGPCPFVPGRTMWRPISTVLNVMVELTNHEFGSKFKARL